MRNLVDAMLVELKSKPLEFKGDKVALRESVYNAVSPAMREMDDFGLALGTVLNRKFVAFAETNDTPLGLRTYAQMILSNAHREFDKDIRSLVSKAVVSMPKLKNHERVKMQEMMYDASWKCVAHFMVGQVPA
tara:strand:- start:474 stop:872 length:399 start_codon:yes stop_codon:yes gene_type:complete